MKPFIEVFVAGTPKAQPRARAFARGGKASVFNPATAEGWKSLIAQAIKDEIPETPITGPLKFKVQFFFERPKKHFYIRKTGNVLREDAPLWHTAKPDMDNLIKAVKDCLTTLRVWQDDSQVCMYGTSTKEYIDSIQTTPGALITITQLHETE